MDRLRDLLVGARLVTEAQVREAERMGLQHNATLAHVLVRGGVIDTQKLAIFLSKKLRLEFVALVEREISPRVLEQLPLAVAQRLRAIPLALRKTKSGEEIVVAMSDPTDSSARREIEHVAKKKVMALVADEVALQRAINRWYGRAPSVAVPIAESSPALMPAVGAPPNPATSAPGAFPAESVAVVVGSPVVSAPPTVASPAVASPAVASPSVGHASAPSDFLTESTLDVAQMYERKRVANQPRVSPLDSISVAPQPAVNLDSDPDSPHLTSTRKKAPAPLAPMGDPQHFLTPSTEEHVAMLGPGGGPLSELSLDEDTAWLRQRLRGEDVSAKIDSPPKASPVTSKKKPPSPTPVAPMKAAPSKRQPPHDFMSTSDSASFTTPAPPRVSKALTTREVGTPASPPRPRSRRKTGNLTPATPIAVADDVIRTKKKDQNVVRAADSHAFVGNDVEEEAKATLASLPSIPSDDDLAAAFDDQTIPVESLPQRAAKNPTTPRDTLPPDSRAVARSSQADAATEVINVNDVEEVPKPHKAPKLEDTGPSDRRAPSLPPSSRLRDGLRQPQQDTIIVDVSDGRESPKQTVLDSDDGVIETNDKRNVNVTKAKADGRATMVDASVDESSEELEEVNATLLGEEPTNLGAGRVPSEFDSIDNANESALDVNGDGPTARLPAVLSPTVDDGPTSPGKSKKGSSAKRAAISFDDATKVMSAHPERTLASMQTLDEPRTQLDLSLREMTLCIVCPTPRLRVDLGRTLRKAVSTLYLEDDVSGAEVLAKRVDVDVLVLVDPSPDEELSESLDRMSHRSHDRPLVLLLNASGTSHRIRRAHLRLTRVDDDDELGRQIEQGVAQMLGL